MQNRESLLNVMLNGLEVKDLWPSANVRVDAPRFMAGRSPERVHRALDTQWADHVHDIPAVRGNEPGAARQIHRILTDAEDLDLVDADSKWLVLHHVQRGDWRPFETLRGRTRNSPHLKDLVQRYGTLAEVVVSVASVIKPT